VKIDDARAAVVAELEQQLDHYKKEAGEQRERAHRLAKSAPKRMYENALTAAQVLADVERRLRARVIDLEAGVAL
jgi:hypothetical protein